MGSPDHIVSVSKMTNQWLYDKTLNGNVHSLYTPQFCCQGYSGTATNMNGFTTAYFRVPSLTEHVVQSNGFWTEFISPQQ